MGDKIIKLRFREKDRDIFEAVKDGRKKVETRAATTKYRAIKPGDEVVLVCGKDKLEKQVGAVRIFRSISALLKKYSFNQINPVAKDKEELIKMYDSFPHYGEKIEKYGLLALELEEW